MSSQSTAARVVVSDDVATIVDRAADLVGAATGAPRVGVLAAGNEVIRGLGHDEIDGCLRRLRPGRPVQVARVSGAAALVAPITDAGGDPSGVIVVARAIPGEPPFDEAAHDAVRAVADFTGRALASRAAIAGVDSRVERADRLNRLLQEIAITANEASTVGAALETAVAKMCAAMDWPIGHAITRDPVNDRESAHSWHLADPERLAAFHDGTLRLDDAASDLSLAERVLEAGEAVWRRDIKLESAGGRGHLVDALGLRSAVAFPVLVGSEVVGVLEFFAYDTEAPDTLLLRTMTSIGAQLGRVVERERARQRDARATAELAAANALKNDFLAMVSHELRTPLTPVLGFSQLLLERWDQIDDTSKLEFARVIEFEARHLALLVDELVTMSQLDSGTLGVRCDRQPIADAIASAIAEVPGAHGAVSVACEPDVVVRADPLHLRRIFVHLLRNALGHGAPPIEITCHTDGADVEVAVRDHGPGVAPDALGHLFERFTRGPSGPAASGMGLGLPVVRGLVEAQGGRAWYEAAEPGARFAFRLPVGP